MMPVYFCRNRAMSQAELLILVAVIGTLSAIAVGAFQSGLLSATRETKLDHDSRALNTAVRAYIAFGGDVSEHSAEEVIALLKSEIPADQRHRFPGLGGSFLDPRTRLVMQTPAEAASGAPRLVWKGEAASFVITREGPPGFKSVEQGDSSDEQIATPQSERRNSLVYADRDNWIWDYKEVAPTFAEGPTEFDTTPVPNTVEAPIVLPPVPKEKDTLLPPQFSIPPGHYPASHYSLALALSDPNPPGTAQVFYSIDFGAWARYSSPSTISVSPDTSVMAQALPIDSGAWEASRTVGGRYEAVYGPLDPPIIEFSKDLLEGGNPNDFITVTLRNPNPSGSSKIVYHLVPFAGGAGATISPRDYASAFSVRGADYPEGFGVVAHAAALSADYSNSVDANRYASATGELEGGHLDLDTATSISKMGKGSTDAHTHDITGKYGLSSINFLSIPDSKQIELDEAITNGSQRFKLIVVNGSLSPGFLLELSYVKEGKTHTVYESVAEYDDRPIDQLETFSFGGAQGTAQLQKVRIAMSRDVLENGGVIPTNTGDVRGNTPGKAGEWRNGAFTLQAVAVNGDGRDAFQLDPALSNGGGGAAASGLLWEGILFWHWSGASYHETGNQYKPGEKLPPGFLLSRGKKK